MKLRERLQQIERGMVLVAPSSAFMYLNKAGDIEENDLNEINDIYYARLEASIVRKQNKVAKLKKELAAAEADLADTEEYRDNYTHILDREIIEECTRPKAGGKVLKVKGREHGKFWDEAEWESELTDKHDIGAYKPLRFRKCKQYTCIFNDGNGKCSEGHYSPVLNKADGECEHFEKARVKKTDTKNDFLDELAENMLKNVKEGKANV